MRRDILERRAEIEAWIAREQSKAFICRELRCKPETLDSYLTQMGIEYRGNRGGRGHKVSPHRVPAVDRCYNGSLTKSHTLKQLLLRDGVKQAKCERCGLDTWHDQPIPLEMHHVNGDRFDNRLINLQILCPNCHAQEPNNSGAAAGQYAYLSQSVEESGLDPVQ